MPFIMGNTITTALYRPLCVSGSVETNTFKLTTCSENGVFVTKGGSALCAVQFVCIEVN